MPHRDLALEAMPPLLTPLTGRLQMRDYEKIFCANPADEQNVFVNRGIDSARGCLVIVRPDQYISTILPLDAHADLTAFFASVLRDQR